MPTFSRLHMYLEDAEKSMPINGDATDLDYLRQILLTSFSWSMKRSKSSASEGGAGRSDRGRPEPEVFSINKSLDKASTTMLTKMTGGRKLNALLTLAAHEESNFKFTIKLSNVRLIDYKINVKDGDKAGDVDEDWTLNYDTIEFQYTPELKPGERTAKPKSSLHKRSANASTDKSDGEVGSIVKSFGALDTKAKKDDAASQLKTKFTDNF